MDEPAVTCGGAGTRSVSGAHPRQAERTTAIAPGFEARAGARNRPPAGSIRHWIGGGWQCRFAHAAADRKPNAGAILPTHAVPFGREWISGADTGTDPVSERPADANADADTRTVATANARPDADSERSADDNADADTGTDATANARPDADSVAEPWRNAEVTEPFRRQPPAGDADQQAVPGG